MNEGNRKKVRGEEKSKKLRRARSTGKERKEID